MKIFKFGKLYRGLLCVFAFLLSIVILASILLEENRIMVDETLKTHSNLTITTDEGDLYSAFVPNDVITDGYLDKDKAAKLSDDYNIAVGEEGAVLLKNNGVLPLKGTGLKVTALGFYSTKWGSSGGWGGGGGGSTALKDGLKSVGIELNPTAAAAYATKNIGSAPNPGYANNKCWGKVTNEEYYEDQSLVNTTTGKTVAAKLHEPTVAELVAAQPDFETSIAEYNDAALVFVGRGSAEGADWKAGEDGLTADSDKARTPLALTDGEKAIINYAIEKFDKVIVLVNATNTMELGFLEETAGVDAVIYASKMNAKNIEGLCRALVGTVNFSGGLNNIYASNSLSSPAMMNMGFFRYTNAEDVKIYKDKTAKGNNDGRIDTSTIGTNGTDVGYTNYLVEAEGIYVGYRYYETRYYDCVMNKGNAKSTVGVYDSKGDWNYSEEVTYGFGFGLSYTTFDKEITNVVFSDQGVHVKNHEKYATVTVKVTNTGAVAGKTSVQIYGQSPYTAYDIENGVEKSAIQLLEFGKTGVIEPGKSESVDVKIDLSYLASYDYKNKKTYIMDVADNYYFATGNGAHDALNNILAVEGKTTVNGMDYNGKAKGAWKWSYNPENISGNVDDFTFSVSKSGEKITNRLDTARLDYYGATNLTVKYLTRNDWSGTYPISYTGLTANAEMLKLLNGHYIETKESTAAELAEVKWNQETDLKFGDMKFAEFNDYRWEELIDSLSLEETIYFAFKGGREFADLSCGFPKGNYAENGASKSLSWNTDEGATNPPWLKEDNSVSAQITLADYALMACTFSHELAKVYGKLSGIGGILGERTFLWQPGANTLRTPYNGRSSQYYCEDPVLTGVNVMEASVEAMKYGGIITAKHFAFNDQELGRSGIAPFMTEQRAREIELLAFQIPVESNLYDTEEKNEGMLGIMTSFSKIGLYECICSEGLLTGILNKEWGYNGYVVSDLKDDIDLAGQAFKCGITGYDIRADKDDVNPYLDNREFKVDADLQRSMKQMVKRTLWCFANSNLMNKVNSTSYSVWNMTWWRQAYISGLVILSVLTVASAAMYALSIVFKKKESEVG